jgi:hypothetical protein
MHCMENMKPVNPCNKTVTKALKTEAHVAV